MTRASLAEITTGKIMNMVSNDMQRLRYSIGGFGVIAVTPFLMLGQITLLILFVGWESLSGILFFILMTLVDLPMAMKFQKMNAMKAANTDRRLGAVSDVIRGIRGVKMNAWEWNFRDEIKKARREEVSLLRRQGVFVALYSARYFTVSSIAILISIVTLAFSQNTALSPSQVFTLVLLMKTMGFAIAMLANSFLHFFPAKVTVNRIEDFLLNVSDQINQQDELNNEVFMYSANMESKGKMQFQNPRVNIPTISSVHDTGASVLRQGLGDAAQVKICNVSAGWNNGSCALRDMSLKATSGQLVIITGPVGSGKSTLLMTILGEVPIRSGSVSRSTKVAYVSQTPWVFSATVRENITFGKLFNKKAFDKALEVCDIQEDLRQFSKGDLSVVGQRGVSLSGGQRVRVSLARAVYSDADVYLLDDPLSAVDADVGDRLFKECICGALAGKTRIVVTHHLQYLQYADYCVMLKDGRIEHGGHPGDLISLGLLSDKDKEAQQGATGKYDHPDEEEIDTGQRKEGMCDMREEDEDRAIGSVKLQLYWEYLKSGLPPVLLVCLFFFLVVMEASVLAPYWWLSRIASMSRENQRSTFTLGMYGGLVSWTQVQTTLVFYLMIYTLLRASEKLHNKMTNAVLKSPILFFDTNPLGRIMNRFSKDIGSMDDILPMKMIISVSQMLDYLGLLVLTAVIEYRLTMAVVPVLVIFSLLSWFYLRSSRELQRIESVKCSPILVHFTETLAGLEIFKAADMRGRFWEKFTGYQDERTAPAVLLRCAQHWLTLNIDLLCSVFIAVVAASSLIMKQDPSETGMILSLAVSLIGVTSFGVTRAAEVENEMTSVERVITYTDLTPEPGYSRTIVPREGWPEQGNVRLSEVSLTYREGNPQVLHGVSVDIPAKQRVGIAGRTGSGKSSLVAALFRLPEPQGIDLGTIDVQSARRAIAVISQDPVLFVGSLRKNMDPFHEFPDEEIWTVFDEVQLFDTIQKLPGQLNFQVGESGTSFSVGERQLLCLARALLRKTKVLVLDEATANVDYKTDLLVQQVLRNKFASCTLLTIAHRVNTIMDYDKVLVMDKGQIVAFDPPDKVFASAAYSSIVE